MLIGAIVVPPAIALPLSLLLASKDREIRRLRHELNRKATYDSATSFFNGRVFSTLVDRRARSSRTGSAARGAFLVVEIENLRLTDMRYGLEWREEALRGIASVIRASVRSEDLVGRLGDTEFGIFLPDASEENARQVGERIRAGVSATYFAAVGDTGLRVTIGGVFFEDALGFEALLRATERQVAVAQESGDIALSRWMGTPAERMAN